MRIAEYCVLGVIGISEIVSLSVGNAVAKIVCSALVFAAIATYAVIEIVQVKRRKKNAEE